MAKVTEPPPHPTPDDLELDDEALAALAALEAEDDGDDDDRSEESAADASAGSDKFVSGSRFGRFMSLTGLGAKMSGSLIGRKLANVLVPRSREKKAALLSKTLERQAERMVEVLGRLKGASMKVGQILSSDPDMVPPEFASVLSRLQTTAPPMPWKLVRSQVESALGAPVEKLYASFEQTPAGAASIGQVHRATLHSGEAVAVKVQYPGVLESLESDLKNLQSLMRFGRALVAKDKLDAWLGEIRSALHEESDYLAEARNLGNFSDLLRSHGAAGRVRAPRPYPEHTRKTVLTMEWVTGTKIDTALLAETDLVARDAIAGRLVEHTIHMLLDLGLLHCDPHPGNFLLEPDGTIALLDFGAVRSYQRPFIDGLLALLQAVLAEDDAAVVQAYRSMGFKNRGEGPRLEDAPLLREYHHLVLEPFLHRGIFDYGTWTPANAIRRFMLRHPRMLALAPPPEALQLLRVMSGLKGLLHKTKVRFDLRAAVERAIASRPTA
ncbi:MAG: AarF/UbiB family protein [Myxococcota bacterium]